MKGNQLIGLIDVMASGKTGTLALLAALLVLFSSSANKLLHKAENAQANNQSLPIYFSKDSNVKTALTAWKTRDGARKFYLDIPGRWSDHFYCNGDTNQIGTAEEGNMVLVQCIEQQQD